jgi:hypothetical protein
MEIIRYILCKIQYRVKIDFLCKKKLIISVPYVSIDLEYHNYLLKYYPWCEFFHMIVSVAWQADICAHDTSMKTI